IRKLAARWLLRLLRRRSLGVVMQRPFDPVARHEGRDWPLFGYTMVGHHRLDNIQYCIEQILRDDIPGDLIETGAWRGGATIFMRAVLAQHQVRDRIVWVADSFEGLPKPKSPTDGWDLSGTSCLKIPLEQVQDNFRRFGLLDDQVRFLKGWFCDTLPGAPIQQLALLRLDGDLYHSTQDALEALYHRVAPGGFVIVDDYFAWPSCRRAVQDFLAKHQLQVDICRIDWTGVFWRKPLAAIGSAPPARHELAGVSS
ncbi:MAG: TylF/MycF/NovP-related O-methyltransferase, partial [Gemmataceae bacterium]